MCSVYFYTCTLLKAGEMEEGSFAVCVVLVLWKGQSARLKFKVSDESFPEVLW